MKIAVCPSDKGGCGFYRLILPYRALRDRGYDVGFYEAPRDVFNAKPDVIVVQRQYKPDIIAFLLGMRKDFGARLIHDIDDNFYTGSTANPATAIFGNGKPATKEIERISQASDIVTVSTPALKDLYLKVNANTVLAPNAVDRTGVERIAPLSITGQAKRDGQIRVGWAGTNTHRGDFARIVKSLATVMNDHPTVKMVFMGDDMRFMLPGPLRVRCEYAGDTFKGVLEVHARQIDSNFGNLPTPRYYNLLKMAEFDVGLAPLENTSFNSSKSWIKAIEYGMAGIPMLASRFGPYRLYANECRDRTPIATADESREWEKKLDELVQSAELRRDFAQANLSYVKRSHLIEQRVDVWDQALSALSPKNNTENDALTSRDTAIA